MTETKRFSVPDKYKFSHSKVQVNGKPLTNDEIVRLLNVNDGAFIDNVTFKKEINELKSINQDHQDHICLLEEEKINLQIKLQKIRDYAMETGEVKQDVIEKVVFE